MRALLVVVVGFAGCIATPPPPMIPMHAGTAPGAEGETTAMVVVGVTLQGLGGGGFGGALRVEHQTTDDTLLGLELGGGKGDEDNGDLDRHTPKTPHWLLAARGYGRTAAHDHRWVAATYGIGVSVLDTGLVALTAHAGGAVSYPNDYFVPLLQVTPAISLPLLRGRAFGEDPQRPRPQLWLAATAGFVVPVADTGNAASAELGLAVGIAAQDPDANQVSFSVADSQRVQDGPAAP